MDYDFKKALEEVLSQASDKKNEEPKSSTTRKWAVFYTEVEKALAYYEAYLSPKPVGGPE